MRILLRVWHLLIGHPRACVWTLLEGGRECESCGKQKFRPTEGGRERL